jgi:hypothetical protein
VGDGQQACDGAVALFRNATGARFELPGPPPVSYATRSRGLAGQQQQRAAAVQLACRVVGLPRRFKRLHIEAHEFQLADESGALLAAALRARPGGWLAGAQLHRRRGPARSRHHPACAACPRTLQKLSLVLQPLQPRQPPPAQPAGAPPAPAPLLGLANTNSPALPAPGAAGKPGAGAGAPNAAQQRGASFYRMPPLPQGLQELSLVGMPVAGVPPFHPEQVTSLDFSAALAQSRRLTSLRLEGLALHEPALPFACFQALCSLKDPADRQGLHPLHRPPCRRPLQLPILGFKPLNP